MAPRVFASVWGQYKSAAAAAVLLGDVMPVLPVLPVLLLLLLLCACRSCLPAAAAAPSPLPAATAPATEAVLLSSLLLQLQNVAMNAALGVAFRRARLSSVLLSSVGVMLGSR
jgi:hypothetical protein